MYVYKGAKSLWQSCQAIMASFGPCLCWLWALLYNQTASVITNDWFILGLFLAGFSAGLCSLVNDCTLSVPFSHLPGSVSPVIHHVCMVVLENHLYKTSKPFQRGTASISKQLCVCFGHAAHGNMQYRCMLIQPLWKNAHNIYLFPWSECFLCIILHIIVIQMEYAADLSHNELIVLNCVLVLSTQIWEGTVWEGTASRNSAGDPEESGHQSAPLHPHRSRRLETDYTPSNT